MFSSTHTVAQTIADNNKSPYYSCECIKMFSDMPWSFKKRSEESDPNTVDMCEIHIHPNVDKYGNCLFTHIDDYLGDKLYNYNTHDEEYLWYHVRVDKLDSVLKELTAHLDDMKLSIIDVSQMEVGNILDELHVICIESDLGRELVGELRRRYVK